MGIDKILDKVVGDEKLSKDEVVQLLKVKNPEEKEEIFKLAQELTLSRSQLHRKLKATTNQSTTEFIRYIRLAKAIDLMKENKYCLNDIAYNVGFNSPTYFTQSFKKQFGISPSTYMENFNNSRDKKDKYS